MNKITINGLSFINLVVFIWCFHVILTENPIHNFSNKPIQVKLFNFYTILKSFHKWIEKYWETQSKKDKKSFKINEKVKFQYWKSMPWIKHRIRCVA